MFNFNSKATVKRIFRLVMTLVLGGAITVSGGLASASPYVYTFSPLTNPGAPIAGLSPTFTWLGVLPDLDSLEVGVEFQVPLSYNTFMSQNISNVSGTAATQVMISLSSSNGSPLILGGSAYALNFATTPSAISYGMPTTAIAWLSQTPFSTQSVAAFPGNCKVAYVVSPNTKDTLTFSLSRSCINIQPHFNVQTEIGYATNGGQSYSYATPFPANPYPVDLSQVPGFKLPQAITAQTPQNVYIGSSTVQLSASDSAGLPLNYTTAGSTTACTVRDVNSNQIQLLSPGTCTINITASGNSTYSAAPPVQVSFQVLAPQLDQSINQDFPGSISLDNPQAGFNASSSSGVPVTVTSTTTNICQVLNSQTIQANNPGTCQLTLSAPTSGNYKAAQQQVSIPVTPAHIDQNVSYYEPQNVHVGGSGFDVDLKNDSGLPLQLTSDTPSVCNFNKSSDPLYVTIVGAGTCSFEVNQDGNDQYSPFSATGVTFQVLPAIANNSGSANSSSTKVVIKASTSTAGTNTKLSTQTNTTGIASTKTTAATSAPTSGVKISAKSAAPTTKIKITTKSASKPAPKPSPSKGKK